MRVNTWVIAGLLAIALPAAARNRPPQQASNLPIHRRPANAVVSQLQPMETPASGGFLLPTQTVGAARADRFSAIHITSRRAR